MTIASTWLALLILGLMTFRGALHKRWAFARTSHFDRIIMLMGVVLFFLIAFNTDFGQPPSRLISEF